MNNRAKVVRIGGASGFWGDSMVGAPQLARSGQIDYLVFDYLAETTMAILAAQKLRKPELGYATDFVTHEEHRQELGCGIGLRWMRPARRTSRSP